MKIVRVSSPLITSQRMSKTRYLPRQKFWDHIKRKARKWSKVILDNRCHHPNRKKMLSPPTARARRAWDISKWVAVPPRSQTSLAHTRACSTPKRRLMRETNWTKTIFVPNHHLNPRILCKERRSSRNSSKRSVMSQL